jgi:hypothetical protein
MCTYINIPVYTFLSTTYCRDQQTRMKLSNFLTILFTILVAVLGMASGENTVEYTATIDAPLTPAQRGSINDAIEQPVSTVSTHEENSKH